MTFRLVAAGLLAFLAVSVASAEEATIRVDAQRVLHTLSPYLTGACIEDVNHEVYGGIDSQMIFGESFQEPCPGDDNVSGMWRPLQSGTALGRYAFETNEPFVGVAEPADHVRPRRGRNRHRKQGPEPLGHVLPRGQALRRPALVQSRKADDRLRRAGKLRRKPNLCRDQADRDARPVAARWHFELTPSQTDKSGRFAVKLKQPGSVALGYAFLQPGEWGRFKGLPVRKDVAEGLIAQGITVLRYGGSMVNAPEYRWKKMIGPRDRRPPYTGTWYPYSSNGWGIFDFLNFCEAAGFLGIPDVNMGETPQDMADFIEYVNGPADSPWGSSGPPTAIRSPTA